MKGGFSWVNRGNRCPCGHPALGPTGGKSSCYRHQLSTHVTKGLRRMAPICVHWPARKATATAGRTNVLLWLPNSFLLSNAIHIAVALRIKMAHLNCMD